MVKSSYLPTWMQGDRSGPDRPQSPQSGRETGEQPGAQAPPSEGARNLGAWIGYRRFVDGLEAYCLLRGKQCGNLWVPWLKDHFTEYAPLATWWAEVLGRLALRHGVPFDAVTCPPSSGKRAAYLAEVLAQGVAGALAVPFEWCFSNPDPRGHRASMQEKLREADGPDAARYLYEREPDGANILVVDDAMCTRQTALRCVDAATRAAQEADADPDRLFFVVIYS